MAGVRATHCDLNVAHDRSGLKFFPYTYTINGLITEDGTTLKGTESEGYKAGTAPIEPLSTNVPANCCGQLRR